ncbi:hypothetical protein V2I01_32260 [Micromonospora sp. BRA006-A]|nr:hypothetical protein [Micromonospora sp. BRA006-A]
MPVTVSCSSTPAARRPPGWPPRSCARRRRCGEHGPAAPALPERRGPDPGRRPRRPAYPARPRRPRPRRGRAARRVPAVRGGDHGARRAAPAYAAARTGGGRGRGHRSGGPVRPVPAGRPAAVRDGRPPVVDETAGGTVDDLDRALLDVLDPARTAGVWRCWRITREPNGTVDAVRVYLVEATVPDDELPAVADRGQRALADAGHAAPVEVYRPDLPLPACQWTARSRSALIWAPQPPGEVRLAAGWDARLPVDDDEVAAFVTHLRSAPALTAHLRTDGAWVWPADVADRLLDEGPLADEGLLWHLRRCRADPPEPAGAVAVHRALAALVRAGAL